VYSEPGVGTTFKILLPAVPDRNTAPHVRRAAGRLPKGNETILLVEDETAVRSLTARLLKQQGYRVVSACEGNEALSKAGRMKGDIDLLLTDVVMPNMNGGELAEKLRRERSEVKVLFFSGYTDAFILKKGLIGPGHAFLQKPFTLEALSRKIREVIDLRGNPAGSPLNNLPQGQAVS